MEKGGAIEEKALALALTYIPGYFNHLENVTDLRPAKEGQSWGPRLGRRTGKGDEEVLLISTSYLTPAHDLSIYLLLQLQTFSLRPLQT